MTLEHLPIKLDFEGANNFRELGGYPLPGGRRVRHGMIYRSDHLGKLSPGDQQLMNELGIRTVIDLRRREERDSNPDRLSADIQQIWLPVAAEGADIVKLRRSLEDGSMTAEGARQHLLAANREFVRDFSDVFRDFTQHLLDDRHFPLVFHCTAGKDRAGFCAAITLLCLGADLDTVFHDYLATNHCTANYINGMVEVLQDRGSRTSPEALRALMQVETQFLQMAFDTAIDMHGSLERYLVRALDMTSAKQEALRSRLVEVAELA